MKCRYFLSLVAITVAMQCCTDPEPLDPQENIQGYSILEKLSGHWVGSNITAFGLYDWFAFDFRPISASHNHSIYEGGTNQNIITSVFIGDIDGEQKIMARNGGWLGNQYRATYFVLDQATKNSGSNYYKLVDAVGGADRSYLEFTFKDDSIYIDAYKDNSGSLDKPFLHMKFRGDNRNPQYAEAATSLFNYPQEVSEANFNGQFDNLIDPDSALFLEESDDPFPKSDHGHISDLTIDFTRGNNAQDDALLLYLSSDQLVTSDGNTFLSAIDNDVIRTIDIESNENSYKTTYLHPDTYFVTIFSDKDGNGFPSTGDYSSISQEVNVLPESNQTILTDIFIRIN